MTFIELLSNILFKIKKTKGKFRAFHVCTFWTYVFTCVRKEYLPKSQTKATSHDSSSSSSSSSSINPAFYPEKKETILFKQGLFFFSPAFHFLIFGQSEKGQKKVLCFCFHLLLHCSVRRKIRSASRSFFLRGFGARSCGADLFLGVFGASRSRSQGSPAIC